MYEPPTLVEYILAGIAGFLIGVGIFAAGFLLLSILIAIL